MSYIAYNLENKTPGQKVEYSGNVDTQIKAHPTDYPGSTEPLEALEEKRAELSEAIAAKLAADTAAAVATMNLELADKAHDLELRVTGAYAEKVTRYDGAKLEAGGFELVKPNTPIGPLPAPINIRTVAGAAPGTVGVSCKAVKGGKTYPAQCALSPTGPWTDIYNGTKPRFIATDLTSGTVYYFRLGVIGAAGQSPWSDISERRAP